MKNRRGWDTVREMDPKGQTFAEQPMTLRGLFKMGSHRPRVVNLRIATFDAVPSEL